MTKDLISLINCNQIINKESIYLLYKYYITKYELYEDCQILEFASNFFSFASYSPEAKKINIDIDYIYTSLIDTCKEYELKNHDYYAYINLKIIQNLLHEIEHVKQIKIDTICSKNLEHFLIGFTNLNMELWTLENSIEKYTETYEYNPNERMAELNSYKSIIMYIKLIKKFFELNKAYNLLSKEAITNKIRGYENEKCPCERYLETTDSIHIWHKMHFYNPSRRIMYKNVSEEYNLEKRLYLGLPIDEKEFKKISFLRDKIVI